MVKELRFSVLNKIYFVTFIICLIAVVIYDLSRFLEEEVIENLRIWYLDPDLLPENLSVRNGLGYYKLTSAIFGIFSCLFLFIITYQLNSIRKSKKEKRLSSLIYYSALYLAIGQLIEIFFIVSGSDLGGLVVASGQFYIPLDTLAITFYLSFAFEVFMIGKLDENSKFVKIVLSIGFTGAFISFTVLINHFIEVNIIFNTIVLIITYGLLIITFLIIINVTKKIFNLSKRVEENKIAVRMIGWQLLNFAVIVVLLALSEQFGGEIRYLAYIFRSIKNVFICVFAYQFLPAFINPSKSKPKEENKEDGI
jgi:hypothetical protein